jgi:hypothetical protein
MLLVAPGLEMIADGCSVRERALHRRFVASQESFMADAQAPPTRYRSILDDSARWDGFAFRPAEVIAHRAPRPARFADFLFSDTQTFDTL